MGILEKKLLASVITKVTYLHKILVRRADGKVGGQRMCSSQRRVPFQKIVVCRLIQPYKTLRKLLKLSYPFLHNYIFSFAAFQPQRLFGKLIDAVHPSAALNELIEFF